MSDSNEQPQVPTIILKLTDPLKFNVECDIELDRLCLMRAMLVEALRVVEGLIEDEEAIKFAGKMNRLQQAQAAMKNMPKLKF